MGYAYRNPTQLSIDCFEYYETMGKHRRLIKLTEGVQTNGKRINRYVSKRNLKDYSEVTVPIPGILVKEGNEGNNFNALNGFYYTIDNVLLYTPDVPNKVLNERLRFDISHLPWRRQCAGLHQLHGHLALLQLDQPDAGHDRPVGCFHVSVPGEEELLDHRSACDLHERSLFHLFHSGSVPDVNLRHHRQL